MLTKNELVLDYFLGDSMVFVGIYLANNLKLLKLPITASELMKSVLSVDEFLRAPATIRFQNDRDYRDFIEANYLKNSRALFNTLLPDDVQSKEIKKLTILLDGSLHRLPFSVLLTDSVTAKNAGDYSVYPFLIKNYTTNYEFSLQSSLET